MDDVARWPAADRADLSCFRAWVRAVGLDLHDPVFAAESGIEKLQTAAGPQDRVAHRCGREADDGWPTPNLALVIEQFQFHVPEPEGIGLASPTNDMPGSRPQRDAQHRDQPNCKNGIVGAGIEDGSCEGARPAAGPEDPNGNERPPTNRGPGR